MIYPQTDQCDRDCRSCALCGTSGSVLYPDMSDRLFGAPGSWNYRRCNNGQCGYVWIDPMPNNEQLEKAYTGYYTHGQRGPTGRRERVRAWFMRAMLRMYGVVLNGTSIGRHIREADALYLGGEPPGRLLEVGCGDGSKMLKMRNLGWQVEGQEVDSDACRVAAERTGLPVYCGDLELLVASTKKYDAIVMIHVIEHVQDPVRVLRVCTRLLKNGGLLVIVTPNVEGLGHSVYGRYWRDLDAPRHLQLFSPTTLSRLAVASGFHGSTVTTTAAHAHFVAGSSIALQQRQSVLDDASRLRWKTAFGAVLFQMREAYALRRNAGCGEECVLMARLPT